MKKATLLILLLLIISGCSKKEVSCIYKNEENENAKSYMRVNLTSDDDIVVKEELYAVYKFSSEAEATNNYHDIERILEQDSTVKIEQKDNNIIAKGQKDVSSSKHSLESKVEYYEQLGYTCK